MDESDDEDHNDVVNDTVEKEQIDNEESEDEEDGRTSAIKEKTKKILDSTVTTVTEVPKKKTKKKKKGKKERLQEAATAESDGINKKNKLEVELVNTNNDEKELEATESTSNHVSNDNTEEGATANNNIHATTTTTNPISNKSKKRRKIRSRQKNVRKDTRTSNQKPEHLKIGSPYYLGRPLTKETREFLNLPESRTSTIRKEKDVLNEMKKMNKDEGKDGNDLKLGLDDFADDKDDEISTIVNDDVKTASMEDIGISNKVAHDSGEVLTIKKDDVPRTDKSSSNTTKRKKKKRSKYKNLQQ